NFPGGPVILVDIADNVGGGCPGDGTTLLQELLNQGARRAVVTIADADAVKQAWGAGLGDEIAVEIGGKADDWHGRPVRVRGRVEHMSDGRYVHKGTWMTGREMNMGRSVVLNSEAGGVRVLLTERKMVPFDAEQLCSQGISPEDEHI